MLEPMEESHRGEKGAGAGAVLALSFFCTHALLSSLHFCLFLTHPHCGQEAERTLQFFIDYFQGQVFYRFNVPGSPNCLMPPLDHRTDHEAGPMWYSWAMFRGGSDLEGGLVKVYPA